jgi:hypothetical protein
MPNRERRMERDRIIELRRRKDMYEKIKQVLEFNPD